MSNIPSMIQGKHFSKYLIRNTTLVSIVKGTRGVLTKYSFLSSIEFPLQKYILESSVSIFLTVWQKKEEEEEEDNSSSDNKLKECGRDGQEFFYFFL